MSDDTSNSEQIAQNNMNSNTKSYFWGILSKFLPQGLYLFTTIILARFLSPDDFGMIGVLAVIFAVANILLDSGLGGSLIKETTITKLDCSTISVFNIIVGIIIYTILFLLAPFIEGYFNIIGLGNVVRILSLIFPISAFGLVPLSLLKRNLEFDRLFISYVSGVVIASIVAVSLAVSGYGVYALVSYQLVNNLVLVILNFVFSKYKLSFAFSSSSFKRLIPFGFFTCIVSIVDTVYENIMTMLTGRYLNVQTAGYLYQAKRLEETMSSSLATAIGSVAFPVLSRVKDDKVIFNQECRKTFSTITLLVFPALITVSLFSSSILVILFGEQWEPSSIYLRVLMFAGIFILMEKLILSFIKAFGQVKQLSAWTLVKRGMGILVLLASLAYNPESMIYAYLFTTFIGFCVNSYVFTSLSGISVKGLVLLVLRNILPVAIYFLVIYFMSSILSELVCMTAAGLYLTIYYLFYLRHRGVNISLIFKGFLHRK